ncbi:Dimethylaniline monooxygenase [Mycena kentingensis (nom. inval.)]|nr:Dimethylaniline monooxygenase [Mycena kentingensis (nom. inval.)]
MFASRLVLALSAATGCLASAQSTFQFPFDASSSRSHLNASDFYEFKWPIRKVAIIGAGVSGLVAYRELVDAGLEVRMFERDAVPGGIWHYTDDAQEPPPIPNADPSVADYAPVLPPQGATLPYVVYHKDDEGEDGVTSAQRWRRHRAPHGVWSSLTSNVPAPMMKFNGHEWPLDTPWSIPQRSLQRYLRSVYSFYGLNNNDDSPVMSYSTRVELVEKRFGGDGKERGWTLTLHKVETLGTSACKEEWWTEDFDAVMIATGTFNAPNIPNIPGLVEWNAMYPESVVHSRAYRHPEMYANQSVIVVGAGPSAVGISADLNKVVKRNLLSWRRSPRSNTPVQFLNMLPQGVQVVVGIDCFHPSNRTIQLADGTFLTDIDTIIFSTGYQYTFPFLPQYHNSSIRGPYTEGPADQPQPLVTDCTHYRSLWRDIVYIDEPTLGFINQHLNIVTSTYGQNPAMAIAKVWAGLARLPSRETMWREYRRDVWAQGGYGKWLTFPTRQKQDDAKMFFSAWLNSAAYEFGGKRAVEERADVESLLITWSRALFYNPNPVKLPHQSDFNTQGLAVSEAEAADIVFRYFTTGY